MKKVLLPIVLAIVGVGITVWGLGRDEYPRVILVGNPTEIPSELARKLPPGYEWIRKEDFEKQEDLSPLADSLDEFASGKVKNTKAVFILFEGTDMDDIMKWARKYGKKEIYFIYSSPPDPDTVMYLSISEVKEKISSIVSVQPAWADTVPDSTCTTGTYLPAGGCIIDSPAQSTGEYWSIKYCFKYASYGCHWVPFARHLTRNLRSQDYRGEGYPASFPHCMDAHNPGGNFVNSFPQPLQVNIHPDTQSIANECSNQVYGCAYSQTEYKYGKPYRTYYIAITKEDRNSYGAIRHELAHHYGYCHSQMDLNIDNVAHCINGNTAGSCVASSCTTACDNWNSCQYSSSRRGNCYRFSNGTYKCCIPGSYSGNDHIYR